MLRRWLVPALALCLAPATVSFSSAAGGAVLTTARYIVVMKDQASTPSVAAAATGRGDIASASSITATNERFIPDPL